MPKINKKQNKRSEKFTYCIFLKIVNNIRDARGANHFTQQITSAFYSIKKRIF